MVDQPKEALGIAGITVSGFKSLRDESAIEIRRLTLLAGANSSGKSSIMQPLLLMKQTLEAPYDPGTLKLDGPIMKFTSIDQFLRKVGQKAYQDLEITIRLADAVEMTIAFHKSTRKREMEVTELRYLIQDKTTKVWLKPKMSQRSIEKQVPSEIKDLSQRLSVIREDSSENLKWRILQSRFMLEIELYNTRDEKGLFRVNPAGDRFEQLVQGIIHVPGLRGNPERDYPATTVTGPDFQGIFPSYSAAVINFWQERGDPRLTKLSSWLRKLGLTSQVSSKRVDDTRVQIQVGRTLDSSLSDTVSIADVGFGVSQVLPVLVALLVAEPGQLVYIEQPELHLHPHAQVELANILADALANSELRIVIETHSDLLLLGIQTLVAEGELSTDQVILHWFQRDKEGITQIISGNLDKEGAYGNWPVDFGMERFKAQSRYFAAAEKSLLGTE